VETNAGFLRALVAGDEFAQRRSTRSGSTPPRLPRATCSARNRPTRVWAQAARAVVAATVADRGSHPFATGDGWRLAGDPAPARVLLRLGGSARVVTAAPAAERSMVVHLTDDAAYVVHHAVVYRFDRPDAGTASARAGAVAGGDVLHPCPAPCCASWWRRDSGAGGGAPRGARGDEDGADVSAPINGVVTDVDADSRPQVRIGHVLFAVRAEED
jgi:acetyl-CoA/propionyl-CoA carboxylase biotin carboxyl carrier protein